MLLGAPAPSVAVPMASVRGRAASIYDQNCWRDGVMAVADELKHCCSRRCRADRYKRAREANANRDATATLRIMMMSKIPEQHNTKPCC